MDDSLINPLRKGVDHFIVTDQGCPGAPEDGSTIVPIRENRYLDPKTKNETDKQVATFTNWFKRIEELSQGRENNFYVGHRPILGIGCNYTDIVTLDWTHYRNLLVLIPWTVSPRSSRVICIGWRCSSLRITSFLLKWLWVMEVQWWLKISEYYYVFYFIRDEHPLMPHAISSTLYSSLWHLESINPPSHILIWKLESQSIALKEG